MSTTNRRAAICGNCKRLVAAGTGTIRHWNGAARKFAPAYAVRSPTGILAACTCPKCEQELKKC